MNHEDAVEGSLLRYGLGELADLYRGEMSLRQVWVRLKALPYDSPLFMALRAERDEAEAKRRQAQHDDVLTRYQPKG